MRDEEERPQGSDYEKLAQLAAETAQDLKAMKEALEESRQQIAALTDKNKEIALQVKELTKSVQQLNPLPNSADWQPGITGFLVRWSTWCVPVNICFWLYFGWTGERPSLESLIVSFILVPLFSELIGWLPSRGGSQAPTTRHKEDRTEDS